MFELSNRSLLAKHETASELQGSQEIHHFLFDKMFIRVDELILACQEKAILVQIGLPSDQSEIHKVFELYSRSLLAKHDSASELQGSQEIHNFMSGNMSIRVDALILACQERDILLRIGLPNDQSELCIVFELSNINLFVKHDSL